MAVEAQAEAIALHHRPDGREAGGHHRDADGDVVRQLARLAEHVVAHRVVIDDHADVGVGDVIQQLVMRHRGRQDQPTGGQGALDFLGVDAFPLQLLLAHHHQDDVLGQVEHRLGDKFQPAAVHDHAFVKHDLPVGADPVLGPEATGRSIFGADGLVVVHNQGLGPRAPFLHQDPGAAVVLGQDRVHAAAQHEPLQPRHHRIGPGDLLAVELEGEVDEAHALELRRQAGPRRRFRAAGDHHLAVELHQP